MAIHVDAREAHFDEHIDEAVIARLLDEAFDVTYGAEKAGLSVWLARPNPNAAERFGFSREVPIVYSRHSRTDARSIGLASRIHDDEDLRGRVEPSVCLLIHNGTDEEVSELLTTVRDDIIIPFQAREIRTSAGRGLVRRRIAEVLGSVDPFAISSPIVEDRNFFGRREFVQSLLSRTRTKKQNSGIFGLRKTGKTSVLHAVGRRLKSEEIELLYIDCQSPAVHLLRWWQLLQVVADRVKDVFEWWPSQVPSTRKWTETNSATLFHQAMRLFVGRDGRQIVLALDEIEYVTPGVAARTGAHWRDDFLPFWQTIRAVHQETGGGFCFVVAGVNPAMVETSHFDGHPNPVFEVAEPMYLGPLEDDAVRDLVRTGGKYGGVSFKSEVVDELLASYGGHPYLTRLACSSMWQQVDGTQEALTVIGQIEFQAARAPIAERLAQPVRDILVSLALWYPDQYDLLLILADEGSEFVLDYLEQNRDAASQFVRYGLVNPEDGSFVIGAIQSFLRDEGVTYREQLQPFARAGVPIDFVTEYADSEPIRSLVAQQVDLENELRRVVLLMLGAHYGFDRGKTAEALVRGVIKRQDRPDPGAVFIGRALRDAMNDLYLSDLKIIVIKNWHVFASVFESQNKFELSMDEANLARRVPAHIRAVTGEDLEAFRVSMAWLIRRLKRVSEMLGP